MFFLTIFIRPTSDRCWSRWIRSKRCRSTRTEKWTSIRAR